MQADYGELFLQEMLGAWVAKIRRGGKVRYLGTFGDEAAARAAYLAVAAEISKRAKAFSNAV